jgi:hypothetical protein
MTDAMGQAILTTFMVAATEVPTPAPSEGRPSIRRRVRNTKATACVFVRVARSACEGKIRADRIGLRRPASRSGLSLCPG